MAAGFVSPGWACLWHQLAAINVEAQIMAVVWWAEGQRRTCMAHSNDQCGSRRDAMLEGFAFMFAFF